MKHRRSRKRLTRAAVFLLVCLGVFVGIGLLINPTLWRLLRVRLLPDYVSPRAVETASGAKQAPATASSQPSAAKPSAAPAPADAASGSKSIPSPAATAAEPTSQTPAAPPGDPPPLAAEPPPAKEPPPPPRSPEALGQPPPWEAALAAVGDAPTAREACFGDFDLDKFVLRADDLKRWFAPVPGRALHVTNSRSRPGEVALFDGLMQLSMPWRPDVALRVSLSDCHGLQIHFFHGEQGVTLIYYERDRNGWAAYATTRTGRSPTPETWALTASDDGRSRRTEFNRSKTFELRWSDGELVLSRGDVVLLRAPLAGLPEEVYWEGKAEVFGVQAVPSGNFPAVADANALALDVKRPAVLLWTERLSTGAQFMRDRDGSVVLTANQCEQAGWVATPLPASGPYQVVLEIEGAAPGSGVFLTRQDGLPHEVVRFVKDRTTNRVCANLREDPVAVDNFRPLNQQDVACVADRVWIRLSFGCGAVRYGISCDGKHWATGEPVAAMLSGPVTGVGLHYAHKAADCRIRLRRLAWYAFPTLASLIDPCAGDRAPALYDAPNFAEWLTRAGAARPPEVDLATWCRSCAVRTLAGGCQRDLGTALLEHLLDDAKARRLPWEQQWALLNEAALLWDVRSDHQLALRLIQRYQDMGLAAFRQAGIRPYSTLRHAAMSVPLPSPHDLRVPNEEAIRWELIQLAHADRWDEALDFCDQLRFFRQHEVCGLTPWVDAALTRYTTRRPAVYRLLRARADWQEPLIEELSKDTYNFLAELQGLLDGGSLADAARSIAAIDAELYQGVAPQPRDRRHLVSLPTAIAMTLDAFPALRQEINAKYGEAAVLRVRQAIREGNVTAVRLATVQFAGSQAAAEAHRWLGDRALAIGWFAHAASQYSRAAAAASIAEQHELAARQRFASAMMGRQVGTAASLPVAFGPAPLAPPQFEALVAEMQQRQSAANTASASDRTLDGTLPKPTGFSMPSRGRLDGPSGRNPQEDAIPNARGYQIDWAGRQIATTVAGDILYTSNRFHVAAYDLNSGGRLWQSGVPPGDPLRSQDWGLIRMRPLVTPTRVFARLLYGRGPMLVCLDRGNGQVVWATEFPGNEYAASDPVLVQGQLLALTLAQQEQGDSMLRLTVFDDGSGVVLRQHDLARINEVWWRRRCCETTALDDGLVAVMSGVTLCCDVSGDVRWLRREIMLPPTEEPRWVMQHFEPPLLAGDRLFVTQPGSYNVQCLDARSGRSIWSRLVPLVTRVLGVCKTRVIVQAENEVLGLVSKTGDVAWRYATKSPLESYLCDPSAILVAARTLVEAGGNRFQPLVTWLDEATGVPAAQAPIRDLQHESPHLGPLVLHRNRYWAFAGRGEQDPNRDFVELVPAGEPEKPPAAADGNVWVAG